MIEFIESIDFAILNWLNDNLAHPVLDVIFRFITHLGDGGWLWIALTAIFLCFKKTRRYGVTMAISLLFSLLITNLTLKPLVNRPRPFTKQYVDLRIDAPHSASFPSGHTSGSFSAALALFHHNKKAGTPALILATLIAFSRLYFFVHYPTDVLGGFLVAFLGSFLASLLTPYVFLAAEKIKNALFRKKD